MNRRRADKRKRSERGRVENVYQKPEAPRRVAGIQFDLLSDEEIQRLGVIEVTPDSVLHSAMGTTDPRRVPCGTCHRRRDCGPGHPGKISLPFPIYNPCFFSVLCKVLPFLCRFCADSLIDLDEERFQILHDTHPPCRENNATRFTFIFEKKKYSKPTKPVECPHCKMPQPDWSFTQKGMHIQTSWKRVDKAVIPGPLHRMLEPFTAESARRMLQTVNAETKAAFGFADVPIESWAPISLLVTPAPLRPTVMIQSMSRSGIVHDITARYQYIAKRVESIKNALKKKPQTLSEFLKNGEGAKEYTAIQEAYCVIISNDGKFFPVAKQHNGKKIESIEDQVKGKQGLFRSLILSKRVKRSGRTVIGGDPTLDPDEVGIPAKMCDSFTMEVRMNALNADDLMKSLRLGPGVRNGASAYTTRTGATIHLKYTHPTQEARDKIEKRNILTVHRHIREDDYVLCNRQPSLHKMGFMAHRVKRRSGETVRLPLEVTSPYNADFDGDEMNIHALQTVEAMAEAQELMAVAENVLSPATAVPCMGPVQDTLTGIYKLTHKETLLPRDEMMQLVGTLKYPHNGEYVLPVPAIRHKKGGKWVSLWTGKQCLDVLLKGMPLEMTQGSLAYSSLFRNGAFQMDEDTFLLRGGNLLCGQTTKKQIGKGRNLNILHQIALYVSPRKLMHFMGDLNRMVHQFMRGYGFTVSLRDCTILERTRQNVSAEMADIRRITSRILSEGKRLGVHPDIIEGYMERVVHLGTGNCWRRIQGEMDGRQNNIMDMVNSGSKGTSMNMVQIAAIVGQQRAMHRRMGIGKDRALLSAHDGDRGLTAGGFVFSSFLQGLNPHEMLYHAIDSREGVVHSCTTTSDTGYIERKIVIACENLIAQYPLGHITANNRLVQFRYGGDGLDPSRMQRVSIKKLLEMSSVEFIKLLTEAHASPFQARQLDLYRRNMVPTSLFFPSAESYEMLPFDFDVMFSTMVRKQKAVTNAPPMMLSGFLRRLERVLGILGPRIRRRVLAYTAFCIATNKRRRNPRYMVIINEEEDVLSAIEEMVHKSLIAPGSCVGVLAGQSIGEPITQLMLNTFHQAGQYGTSQQMIGNTGIGRLREIIDLSKPKAPNMTLRLKDGESGDERYVAKLQSVKMTDLVKVYMVHKDPIVHRHSNTDKDPIVHRHSNTDKDPIVHREGRKDRVALTSIAADEQLMENVSAIFGHIDAEDASPFIARLTLDKNRCIKACIGISQIAVLMRQQLTKKGVTATLIHSSSADKTWVIRVRMWGPHCMEARHAHELVSKYLHPMRIGGISCVSRAMLTEETVGKIGRDGAYVESKRPVILTRGSNMLALHRFPFLNPLACVTSDISEMASVLGIRAAREAIVKALHEVLTSQGDYVDYHHISLLADAMTNRGVLIQLNRFSMKHLDSGALHKMSFEEQFNMMKSAMTFGEEDPVEDITSNVIVGQEIPGGTGIVEVVPTETGVQPEQTMPYVDYVLTERDRDYIDRQDAGVHNERPVKRLRPRKHLPPSVFQCEYVKSEESEEVDASVDVSEMEVMVPSGPYTPTS